MVYALILAGGVGSRAGEKIPKQFVEVDGKPVIIYTLEKFSKCKMIDQIYVVCLESWKKSLENYINQFRIEKVAEIVDGGENGLLSVKNGLDAMNASGENSLVMIHDGVRPFVDVKSIEENIKIAAKYGVAVTTVDLVETLVYCEDDVYSDKIISRDHLKRVMTPQTFRYGDLKKLYQTDLLNAQETPSTFALYMKSGKAIYCSKGSEKNIKLTYPEDILYFKKMFKE